MIHRIFSSLSGFKNLSLGPGLNVLVADKTQASTDRQTRNRAGKSSLVELIHFALGANSGPEGLFRHERIEKSEFGLELDVAQQRVEVRRSGEFQGSVAVAAPSFTSWPVQPKQKPSRGSVLSLADWRNVLGAEWFGLGSFDDHAAEANLPSARSLFGYFARRENAGGFIEPVRQNEKQQPWDQQVALSYLLGLDWTLPRELENVHRQEKALKTLKTAARDGALGDMLPKSGELKSRLLLAKRRLDGLRATLQNFEVLPEYRELEQEANKLTSLLNELMDANAVDNQLVVSLDAAMRDESPPDESKIEKLYAEAGIIFPENVLRRVEEVRSFHRAIITNRRSYLESERNETEHRINQRRVEQQRHDARRGEIMRLLQSKGALDQFQSLQAELAKAETQVSTLKSQLEAAEQLESRTVDLGIRRGQLTQRLQLNLSEQATRVDEAVNAFQTASANLYEEAG
jgi:uncharacterized protein YydD (DUF2326 family)